MLKCQKGSILNAHFLAFKMPKLVFEMPKMAFNYYEKDPRTILLMLVVPNWGPKVLPGNSFSAPKESKFHGKNLEIHLKFESFSSI